MFDAIKGVFAPKKPHSSVDKTDEVTQSEKLLQDYRSLWQDWANMAHEWDRFRNGDQLDDKTIQELVKRHQSTAIYNIIYPAVETAKAILTANPPRFQTIPMEDSDVKLARVYSDLMGHIWNVSNGVDEFTQLVDDFYVRSMGVWFAYIDMDADFGRGEVKVKCLDPFTVFIDPNSKDPFARDASSILIVDHLTAEQAEAQYGMYKENLLDGAEASENDLRPQTVVSKNNGLDVGNRNTNEDVARLGAVSDTTEVLYRVIDRYTKVRKKRYHVTDLKNGKEHILTESDYQEYINREAIAIITTQGIDYVWDGDALVQMQEMRQKFGQVFHFTLPQRAIDEAGELIEIPPQPVAGEPTPDADPNSRHELVNLTIGELIDMGEVGLDSAEVPVDRVKRVLSLGGKQIYKGIIEVSEIPIVPVMNNHNRNPYPLSDIYFVKDLQDSFNNFMRLITTHTANTTGVKVFVAEGMKPLDIEKKLGQAGVSVIEYDAGIDDSKPVFATIPPLSNQVFQVANETEGKVQKVLGIYDLMSGDPSQSPDTYRATLSLEENGQRRIANKRRALERGLTRLGKIVAEMIPQVYTHRKVIRLTEPNMDARTTVLNQPIYNEYGNEVTGKIENNIAAAKFDVQVVSGSTLPNNRWARAEYYLALYEKGVIDQIEMLKQTEVADIEGVLERMSKVNALMQQNEALQQEIKRLSGDLQTADRESVNSKKRLEIEKFKARVSDLESALKATTEIDKARSKDLLNKVKEETNVTRER